MVSVLVQFGASKENWTRNSAGVCPTDHR